MPLRGSGRGWMGRALTCGRNGLRRRGRLRHNVPDMAEQRIELDVIAASSTRLGRRETRFERPERLLAVLLRKVGQRRVASVGQRLFWIREFDTSFAGRRLVAGD